MEELALNAYAKINLTLDVLGTRPDGFHEVQMVMQSVALADKLYFQLAPELSLTCTDPELPVDATNLVLKSARVLQELYQVKRGATIHLEKHIPMAAGLAGGSSNAAATLWGLNILWDLRLAPGELLRIGAQLGSDIPFCLIGGTALAQGRGERLTLLPQLPKQWLVLVKPDFGVATGEIYQKWDEAKRLAQPTSPKFIAALEQGAQDKLWDSLDNHLEDVTCQLYPEVSVIKEKLLQTGAKKAVMSGSGPTVYGIMEGQEAAEQAARLLRKQYSQVFVTHTL